MDDKLKQIIIDRISVSGASAGQAIIVSDDGNGLQYGNVQAPLISGSNPTGGPFTGNLGQTFCVMEVTGNISGFTFSNLGTGKTSTIKLVNNNPNTGFNLFFDTGIKFIGGAPGGIESGSQGLLSLVSYDTGVDGQLTGQVTAGYAAEN